MTHDAEAHFESALQCPTPEPDEALMMSDAELSEHLSGYDHDADLLSSDAEAGFWPFAYEQARRQNLAAHERLQEESMRARHREPMPVRPCRVDVEGCPF